ncbi:MAG: phosphatase PAP2 family protein [Clostridia bacterium]|nr:phosphatase PAP2 family protein [Clostridia bacterium]
MAFLRLLEGLRNPICDSLMNAVTLMGDETVFLVVCLIVFWCVCKQEGYFLLAAGLGGTIANQWLKIALRVPRPWVVDETFTIVEKARAGAAGYSFPSSHSQNAVSTFGGIALWTKRRAVRVIGIALAILVCFSRMYLGVHTPLDVGVGALCAVVMIFALRPLMKKADPRVNRILLCVMFGLSLAFALYITLASFPADIDPENFAEAVKNAHTLLGCSAGFLIVHELDARYIRFDTRAVWWAQVLKTALGLGLVLALRVGLKPAVTALLGASPWASAVRYFILVLFAGGVWPLTFRFFGRLGKNDKDQ